MGTKRPFDEDLQEFIKHPKHIENENKPDSLGEDKRFLETSRNVEVEGVGGVHSNAHENTIIIQDTVDKPLLTGPAFCSDIFPDFFQFNTTRRQLVHYDDTYSSLFNCSPRKEVPIGPEHQADIPEFDPNSARNYVSDHGLDTSPMGICVISQTDCNCIDSGSIRCVQEHVNESRLNLKESLGIEKFNEFGFDNMGEDVAEKWNEEDEQLFQNVVYSNPVSHGKRFWEELSRTFYLRTKKELVSYYFNVFILRRRAVQNRSQLLAIDSDNDEWWGSKRGNVVLDDQDFHLDRDSSSDDNDENHDFVIGVKEGSRIFHDEEKPVNNCGSRSESCLHWDPPYSTMGSTKGVDLLPTCNMIEEIFGSSKTGKST